MARGTLLLSIVVLAALSASARADVLGVPMPRGTRTQPGPALISGRGFRDSVDFFRRWIDRQGLAADVVPVMARRGVELGRFLSRDPRSPWLAIHVFRSAGTTYIVVVPRPSTSPDPAKPAQPP